MQSRTEMSHDKLMRRQNLPRGYFKKRKHESEDVRPPDIAIMTQKNCIFSANYKSFVNTRTFWKVCIVLILCVAGGMASTTIEPDLKVLSLEAPRESDSTAIREQNESGICYSMDLRFDLVLLEQLRGCRVVEGSVVILLMDDITQDKFVNYSFPELVEITGFLMLYRISGIKSLNDLFPNLAVIRGKELFKDYSLIIYEGINLEEVGLTKLQTIVRGGVRIEKNDFLCFAERIDWSLIAHAEADLVITKNKLSAHCPLCESHCPKPKNDPKSTHTLCWNQQNCQIKCNCPNGGVCSDNKKCCDKDCIGGCEDNNPEACLACKNITVEENGLTVCKDSCPPHQFEYLQRRCVTREQCYELNNSVPKDSPNAAPFIPFKRVCMPGCPSGFVDKKAEKGNETICAPCGTNCQKKCQSKIIDSIAAAQSLKGCSIIEGPLEIQIRSSTKSFDQTNNVVKELETSLSEIVEIQDYLKIARSFPIVSLSFLKKLKIIRGKRLESNKYSLVVWDNQNLQELWDENQEVNIENGKLFFHYNPKLCFFKIERLVKNSLQIENYEFAQKSNGDKTPCNVTKLEVSVANILPHAALLNWKPLKLDDERSLLSYVVFYIAAPYQNITLWQNRDACGNDGWLVDDVNDFNAKDAFIAYPLTRLEPYTQYAYYVKAYTLATERTGAQSEINYFRTLPGQPQAITKFKAVSKSSSTMELTWEPPRKINGKLSHYILKAKVINQKKDVSERRDYCLSPFELTEIMTKAEPKPIEQQKPFLETALTRCDCASCAQACLKKEKDDDENRQRANDFEDEIQDFVYVRQEADPPKEARAKRQVQQFPEDNLETETAKKKDQDNTESKRDNTTEDFVYFYKIISDPGQTSFELYNLTHYTNYQIFLRACRENLDDSTTENIESNNKLPDDIAAQKSLDEQCGPETQITQVTLKKEENDIIPWFEVQAIPSNNSLGSIKISWGKPERPNGLILSYTIRYKKNDIDHTKYEPICITEKHYANQSFYILDKLTNGNYSISVAATSMAGMGNYTVAKNVVISLNETSNMWYIVLGLTSVFAILILAVAVFFKRYYSASMSASMKLIASVNPDYAGVHYKQDSWEVPRDKVIQLHELGQGSFGMVYEGIIKDLNIEGGEMRCAIKTVNENATDKERISFLNEASVMKQFDTAFVVRLLGVVSQSQPTFVVMELMANGDLKGYLRSHRPEYDNGTEPSPQPPTLKQLFQMSAEIADGMSYLSAKKFVHRDLAARNCMVAEDLTVKIGDFGMTRDIYETDYYRKGTKGLLPVRWMSPESLKDGVFTSSSDVFSYGVVLWEMATLASQPYQGLSNDQVLRYVIDGGVMERPENCPDKLYELMRRCWQHRPSGRPTFMEIIETLLDDVNQNFRNISFFFTKEGQDVYNQQRLGDFAVNINDDVTTPLRQGEEETTSSIEGNHFLMEEMNSENKLHDL